MTSQSFDPTKPVQTRSGLPARIITTDRKHPRSLVALILDNNYAIETLQAYFPNGLFLDSVTDGSDLVNVLPIKKTFKRWFVVWRDGSISTYETNQRAKDASNTVAVFEREIEYTEGEQLK